MINKIEAGIGRFKVTYILGKPSIIDALNSNKRKYIYGLHANNNKHIQRVLILFFNKKDNLSYIKEDKAAS